MCRLSYLSMYALLAVKSILDTEESNPGWNAMKLGSHLTQPCSHTSLLGKKHFPADRAVGCSKPPKGSEIPGAGEVRR